MPQTEVIKRNGYYDVILLCLAFVLILAYSFYEDYAFIKYHVKYSESWDLESIALVANYPLSLALVYFLYKGKNIAWVLFVIMCALVVFITTVDFLFELQLPEQSTDDSLFGQFLDLMDPRLGPVHYLTIMIIYGALVIFAMRDKVMHYFSISKNYKIIAIATPIVLAILYWYRSL